VSASVQHGQGAIDASDAIAGAEVSTSRQTQAERRIYVPRGWLGYWSRQGREGSKQPTAISSVMGTFLKHPCA
jgi:hypothetical protein